MHRIEIWLAPFLRPSESYTFRRYFWGTLYNPLSFPHEIGRVEQIVYWILHYLLRYRQHCTSQWSLVYVIPCTGTRLCLSLLTAVWTILSNVGSASQDTWRWKCKLELQTKVREDFTITEKASILGNSPGWKHPMERTQFHVYLQCFGACLACLNSVFALVGATPWLWNLRELSFEALLARPRTIICYSSSWRVSEHWAAVSLSWTNEVIISVNSQH